MRTLLSPNAAPWRCRLHSGARWASISFPKPLLLAEESDGGLFLHPSATVFMRNIPKAQIRPWIVRAEAAMRTFHATEKAKRK